MKQIYLFLIVILLRTSVLSVSLNSGIEITVHDLDQNLLESVRVEIGNSYRILTTDKSGRTAAVALEPGVYNLAFSKRNFITRNIELDYSGTDTSFAVQLFPIRIQQLEKMTVVATASPRATDQITRTVSVVSEEELKRGHSQSVSDALGGLPGVQLADQGPNIKKPVIRGMTNQRIVIAKQGVRHEAQQWSLHHTPEIDVAGVSGIEVLRGPGGILYGSGAIGGVVFLHSQPVLTIADGAAPLSGALDYQYFTNTDQHAGALRVNHAFRRGGLRLNISGRNANFFSVPGRNHFLVKQAAGEVSPDIETEYPGFKLYNIGLKTAVMTDNYEISAEATHYHEEQKLIGEGHWHNSGGPDGGPWFHVAEPIYSPTVHQKIQLGTKLFPHDNHTLSLDIAGQHDHRQGIPGSMGVQVDLKNYYATADARWGHVFFPKLPGTVGLSLSHKRDRSDGIEVLIPDFNTDAGALYALQEAALSQSIKVSLGVRTDIRSYSIFESQMTEGFRPLRSVTIRGTELDTLPALIIEGGGWMAVPSFSGGMSMNPKNSLLSGAVNFGSGFRLADPNELAILGAHHGSYEYLVGLAVDDPSQGKLKLEKISDFTETAYNSDLIVRMKSGMYDAEAALFYNRIAGYIYANPTGEFIWLSNISALPVKEYVQTDARFYGFEFSNSFRPLDVLTISVGYDIVIGEITGTKSDRRIWLPDIQPPRINGSLELELPVKPDWIRVVNFSAGANKIFAQKRLAEFENVLRKDSDGNDVVFESEGYFLVDIRTDTYFELFSRQAMLSLMVHNLFNTEYTSHLSNYKGIAKNQGFDFSVKMSVEF